MSTHEPDLIRFRLRDILLWGLLAIMVSCTVLALSGCSYSQTEWLGRQLSGLDCRPDKLDAQGRCVAAR